MNMRDLVGLGTAVLVLAGLSMAITRGGDVAKILEATGNSFSTVVRAATLR